MLNSRAKRIKLVIFDVDGVLTDGRMVYDDKGREMKFFDVHDGVGIYLLNKSGIKTAIITARKTPVVSRRAKHLDIKHVFQGNHEKIKPYRSMLKKHNLKDSEVCFIADDVVDISIMRRVGLPVAVKNAVREVKHHAAYVTKRKGGRGAVREIAEIILKSQNKWNALLKKYFGV
jgi:3-deoxy-D-manno-octulosonate 8-phosphate phosphatase (KDO 8-P phosphatase)